MKFLKIQATPDRRYTLQKHVVLPTLGTRMLHSRYPLLIQNFLSKLLAHPSNFIKSMKTFTGQSVWQSYVLSLIIFLYVRNILYVIGWRLGFLTVL